MSTTGGGNGPVISTHSAQGQWRRLREQLPGICAPHTITREKTKITSADAPENLEDGERSQTAVTRKSPDTTPRHTLPLHESAPGGPVEKSDKRQKAALGKKLAEEQITSMASTYVRKVRETLASMGVDEHSPDYYWAWQTDTVEYAWQTIQKYRQPVYGEREVYRALKWDVRRLEGKGIINRRVQVSKCDRIAADINLFAHDAQYIYHMLPDDSLHALEKLIERRYARGHVVYHGEARQSLLQLAESRGLNVPPELYSSTRKRQMRNRAGKEHGSGMDVL